MVRQFARRASRGCAEASWGVVETVEAADGFRERLVRRVSWTPGAEGAEGLSEECWVAWLAAGTMRRDCEGGVRVAFAGVGDGFVLGWLPL